MSSIESKYSLPIRPEKEKISEDPETSELRRKISDLSEDDFIEAADLVMSGILPRISKERGRLSSGKWGHFDLPTPDKEDPERLAPLVSLDTVGCYHSLGKGGCSMCDYGWGGGKKTPENLTQQAEEALEFLKERNRKYKEAQYNIIGAGSFFDDREIPSGVREMIYSFVAQNKINHERSKFITETRLEFINEDNLRKMREMLGDDVVIEIGYGMESTDRLVREVCVHKQLPVNFREKLELMKEYNIDRWGHIIMKPPFLTEKESIDDAEKSIKDLLDNDMAEHVILMSMNIRKASLVGRLGEEGKYELPSVWSTIEVMRRLGPERCSKLSVFGFTTGSGKEKTVGGCDECDKEIKARLMKWRGGEKEWHDLMEAADLMDCPCKKTWQQKVKEEPKYDLKTRAAIEIDGLSQEYLNNSFIKEAEDRKARTTKN